MKNSKIVLLFVAVMMFSYAKAEEINLDFDGKNFKSGITMPFEVLLDLHQKEKQVSDVTVPTLVAENLEGKTLYDIQGNVVREVFVKKIIKFKSFTNGKEYIWAIDDSIKAYAVGTPMLKSDFEKIKPLIYSFKIDGTTKGGSEHWQMVSSEEVGEVEEISDDGIKKKICRIIKEIWCRWSCLGAPEPGYPNCVQECKEVFKKVCG